MSETVKKTPGTVEKMKIVAEWLDEKKGRDIMAMNVSGLCSITEGLVVVSAGSVKHGQALADTLLDRCGEVRWEYLGMEGYQSGGWILVDLNDVLVHIFQEDSRTFYNLEGLWAEAERVELELPEHAD
ncbi:ribosome-associated protein [Desulfobaculum xiamenense]|uniref:Ribosomal silencing factor RsfS n=1 Tax=Desulfobaculum xiamenense TaxID=995050 RepID=A0A846QEA9_9BACT|nr:ribosome silencing factor [Desulfobaculum xiamenense]NJB66621.1 ribosome-associated protein [Desulfobaculum xiamenense]